MLTRNFRAPPDARCKVAISLGPLDERRIAEFREIGAWVPGSAGGDLLIASLDQNVGHALGKIAALRDGEEMILALLLSPSAGVSLGNPLELGKIWPRHVKAVVERQL